MTGGGPEESVQHAVTLVLSGRSFSFVSGPRRGRDNDAPKVLGRDIVHRLVRAEQRELLDGLPAGFVLVDREPQLLLLLSGLTTPSQAGLKFPLSVLGQSEQTPEAWRRLGHSREMIKYVRVCSSGNYRMWRSSKMTSKVPDLPALQHVPVSQR